MMITAKCIIIIIIIIIIINLLEIKKNILLI